MFYLFGQKKNTISLQNSYVRLQHSYTRSNINLRKLESDVNWMEPVSFDTFSSDGAQIDLTTQNTLNQCSYCVLCNQGSTSLHENHENLVADKM